MGVVIGIVLAAYCLNFFVLERLLIPDSCYYHAHAEPGWVTFLYNFPSGNGYHPTPSMANMLITLFAGLSVGLLLQRKVRR